MITLLPLLIISPLAPPQLAHAAFEKKLESAFVQSGVPGAAIGVLKGGKVIYRKAFGLADIGKKTPFTTGMAFEIGSLSKQFIAVSILMLVKDGKLALTDPIGNLLPNLPDKWRAATVEQVLHHMSGIPDYEEIAGYDFYNKARDPKEVIDSALSKEPAFKPGERFSYSNTGYFLLSKIVEAKSGVPSGEFLERRVFKPVGMASTYAVNRPPNVRVPTGYHSRTGTRVAQPPIAWTSSLGAGAIVSTLDDMAKWDAALYTEKLLPASLLNKLWETTKTTDGAPVNYGFGWFMGSFRGVPLQDHSGQTNGFTCFYNRFPQSKTSVISLANTYDGGVYGLASAASAHFVPGLNYYSLKVPEDPDAQRTKTHLAAIRQAFLNEGDLKLLALGLQNFAKDAKFAATRSPLKAPLESTKSFRFVRSRTFKSSLGSTIDEYLYRHTHDAGELFWTVRVNAGLVSSLNWEEE
jgi:CubicO group peptidase (beta-lactamase class C family)